MKPDQLDVALWRELVTIREQFTVARRQVRTWQPAPMPKVRT